MNIEEKVKKNNLQREGRITMPSLKFIQDLAIFANQKYSNTSNQHFFTNFCLRTNHDYETKHPYYLYLTDTQYRISVRFEMEDDINHFKIDYIRPENDTIWDDQEIISPLETQIEDLILEFIERNYR